MLSALGLLQAGASLEASAPRAPSPLLSIVSLAALPECAAEFVELMLAKGADPDASGPAGERALHACARLGRPELALALIEAGADLNALDDEGRTPLMLALELAPDAATPALLIEKGARLEPRDRLGRDAQSLALARGESAVARAIAAALAFEATAAPKPPAP
jgi:ankyrin repeat protein